MTHGTRHTPVLFLGLQRVAVTSLLPTPLPGHRGSFGGCLLAHLTSCLGRTFLTPLEQLPTGTSAMSRNCPGASVSAAVTLAWYQGQETLKSQSLFYVLHSLRERLTWNWHFLPTFGKALMALLWAQGKCLHCCLAGVSLLASRKGVCPSPGFGVFPEETKWKHRVLRAPSPSVGITSTTSLSSPLPHLSFLSSVSPATPLAPVM